LFGGITYELMASYWPTPHALKNDPEAHGNAGLQQWEGLHVLRANGVKQKNSDRTDCERFLWR
jgi:hypothetical protein